MHLQFKVTRHTPDGMLPNRSVSPAQVANQRTLMDATWARGERWHSTHTAQALLLPVVLNYLEEQGRPYMLAAHPGERYTIHETPHV